VLVVAQPSISFSGPDAAAVKSFLLGGGMVLVADKSGVANTLLSQLGSAITIENEYSISDPTYNWKAPSVPTAVVLPGMQSEFRFLDNVTGIALNLPSPLALSGSAASVLAETSQFSFTGSNQGSNSTRGPFAVLAAQSFGKGELVVVGDSQFLLNSEWTIANDKVLIGNLFSKGNVYFDASHWGVNSIAQLKAAFSQYFPTLSASPMRYIATLFIVGFALALVPSPKKGQRTAFNAGKRGADS